MNSKKRRILFFLFCLFIFLPDQIGQAETSTGTVTDIQFIEEDGKPINPGESSEASDPVRNDDKQINNKPIFKEYLPNTGERVTVWGFGGLVIILVLLVYKWKNKNK